MTDRKGPTKKKFLQTLMKEVGDEGKVITRDSLLHIYSFDQSDLPSLVRFFLKTKPDFVFQPRTVSALAKFIVLAGKEGIPVVPRGQASWGLGGCLAPLGGGVVDLSVLGGILEINEREEFFTVQPGAKWFEVSQALAHFGLEVMAYPTSWFSTVGGWVSTGGVGVGSLKYGHFSNQVRFIELLTPNGEMLKVKREDDLFPCLFGSEGQLGVITRVSIQAKRREKEWMLSFAFKELPDAISTLDELFESAKNVTDGRVAGPERLGQLDVDSGDKLFDGSSVLFIRGAGGGLEETQKIFRGHPNLKRLEEHKTTYLWHEFFSPLKVKRLGPGLVAANTVLGKHSLPEFFELSRETLSGTRVGTEVFFGSREDAHVMGFLPVRSPSSPAFFVSSVLPFLFTELAGKLGGKPYGIGLWNLPFLKDGIDKESLKKMKNAKLSVDPSLVMNPGKFLTPERLEPFWKVVLSRQSLKLFSLFGRRILPSSNGSRRPNHRLNFAERYIRGEIPPLRFSALSCSRCGSCVPVCPAYLVTGDELVSARGKLMVSSFSREKDLFFCMHCKMCSDVCQNALPLEEAWNELELSIEREKGRPQEEIEEFVRRVEEKKIMENLKVQ